MTRSAIRRDNGFIVISLGLAAFAIIWPPSVVVVPGLECLLSLFPLNFVRCSIPTGERFEFLTLEGLISVFFSDLMLS